MIREMQNALMKDYLLRITIENVSDKTFDKVIKIENEEQLSTLVKALETAVQANGKPLADAYTYGECAGAIKTILTIGIGAGATALGALLVKKIYNKKNKKD